MPDPIDAAELVRELVRPGGRWRVVDVVAETGSTNVDLAARARRGEAAGAVLVASYQSAGRGRQGRTWTAPPGTCVAVSVLLRPSRPAEDWTWLPLLTGLAVADALAGSGVVARLKWPNDVLVGDRKICGILAERVETPSGPACVVGSGINVSVAAAELPVPTATSLAVLQPGVDHDQTALVAGLLAAYDLWLGRWEVDAAGVAAAYRQRSATLGRTVAVELTGRPRLSGTAVDIAPDGRLVVRSSGSDTLVGAGDVVHLR